MEYNVIIFDTESCRKDQDCTKTENCIPPRPNPKVPKPKGKLKEKLCGGTGKLCTKTSDCQLRNCVTTTKKCERPKFKPTCYSDADCNQAPKCIVKPGGKKVKGKPAPKRCKGNDAIECKNDVHCKIDGCSGKKCSSAMSKYFNFSFICEKTKGISWSL